MAVLDHLEDVGDVLLPAAQLEQVRVELLDAHTDPRHARVPHCVELRPGEQLGHALDRDLDVARGSRATRRTRSISSPY